MSTQVKLRRGTRTEHNSFTGVVGELTIDTTNNRAVVHNAVKVGGYPLLNFADSILNTFKAATGTLSAGVYTMTLDTAPAAYAIYFEVWMKPSANNTGAVNVNINSLGSVDIKKVDSTGTIVELDADDLRANIPVKLIYDGTRFLAQLGGGSGGVKGIQWFSASGTYTPTTGATWAIIFSQGAGGGGDAGGTGGNTTVGAVATGNGAAGRTGGTAANGTVNLTGADGANAQAGSGATNQAWAGGNGANARFLGAAGLGGCGSGSNGTAALANSGSGGGAHGSQATSASGRSGGGAGGLAIKLYSCASGAQTVTIGAAGSAGTNGAAGGSGYVLVFEF